MTDTQIKEFIGALYRGILRRSPSPEEIDYWFTDMTVGHGNGPQSADQVRAAFYNGSEYLALQAAITPPAPTPVLPGGGAVPVTPTPATTDMVTAPPAASWFDGTTNIFGTDVSNTVLAIGVGLAAMFFFSKKR